MNGKRKYFFLLSHGTTESASIAKTYLEEIGVRVLNQQEEIGFIALANPEHIESAYKTGMFVSISGQKFSADHLKSMSLDEVQVANIWNHSQDVRFDKLRSERSLDGRSWGEKGKEPPLPHSFYNADEFKQALQKFLKTDEKMLLRKYRVTGKPVRLEGERFVQYEKKLTTIYKDPTVAYHLARLACHLGPEYQKLLLQLPSGFIGNFFAEPACWKLENEISVGIIFVESSQNDGPKFSNAERNRLQAEIIEGLDWLALEAPSEAHLSWICNWQYTQIDVSNGTNSSSEDYWRNPAMDQINYFGNTYSQDLKGVVDYREDMRQRNGSSHAIVIFVTPYGNFWHAYAIGGRLTLADRNNWGGWGIKDIDLITAHEVCHLFGAADEYSCDKDCGTPCSSCASTHGCYKIPNGNCGACARPVQKCIMEGHTPRICAYTRGQLGWSDLFVELTTSNVHKAGTNDNVWLDIGDRTFALDTSKHDDRERNNVEGYALPYTGLTKNNIKRVGIRKSKDGDSGGWNLNRVRLWVQGDLLCDENNINAWLEDDYRWWASTRCGSPSEIVNHLKVIVTTANVKKAGTDDTVRLDLGGRSWYLNNSSRDDFERGRTDTFYLDPGSSLYRSNLGSIRIHKFPDGKSGGWKLKGLQIYVNGSRIYNNQSINKWVEDNDRDWYGTIA